MKYIKKDMTSYGLHIIKTDKFKTVTFRVVFRSPIVKEEVTMRNILCNMFLQSNKKYNSKRALTIKAQDLYAADIHASNNRVGNYIFTNFYLSILNDKYTEKGNMKDSIEFLSDIIFDVDVCDNKFRSDMLDIVKNNCKNSLESIKENASNYSLIRMYEAFNKECPASIRTMGYLDDLDKINEENLYEYYERMINNDLVDILVIGDVDEEEITKYIRESFKFRTLKKDKGTFVADEIKPRSRRLFATETIDNNQSKVSICCTANGLDEYERNYVYSLYNIILGGSADSKLFREVREENSLCYTVHSSPCKLDNLLVIRAGIDKENFKKTVDLIEKNIIDMKKGKFTDKEIDVAKEYFSTALEELEESENRILDNYLMMDLLGIDSIEERKKMISKVTKNEIIKVAKKIEMDTIFCLEGIKDERD